jgi:ABC-type glycerol-3-phosphate transport system permease component
MIGIIIKIMKVRQFTVLNSSGSLKIRVLEHFLLLISATLYLIRIFWSVLSLLKKAKTVIARLIELYPRHEFGNCVEAHDEILDWM